MQMGVGGRRERGCFLLRLVTLLPPPRATAVLLFLSFLCRSSVVELTFDGDVVFVSELGDRGMVEVMLVLVCILLHISRMQNDRI